MKLVLDVVVKVLRYGIGMKSFEASQWSSRSGCSISTMRLAAELKRNDLSNSTSQELMYTTYESDACPTPNKIFYYSPPKQCDV